MRYKSAELLQYFRIKAEDNSDNEDSYLDVEDISSKLKECIIKSN